MLIGQFLERNNMAPQKKFIMADIMRMHKF